jgi:hypothetical protein
MKLVLSERSGLQPSHQQLSLRDCSAPLQRALQPQGSGGTAANRGRMPEALLSLAPTALVLWLLTVGREPSQSWSPTREQLAMVTGGAVLLGPLALALLGFFGWLLLVAAGALLLLFVATMRDIPLRRRLG